MNDNFYKRYAYTKSYHLSFPYAIFNQLKIILRRIHTNIYRLLLFSIGKAKYILTTIDDTTCYAMIYFLMVKSKMFRHIVQYYNYTEQYIGKKLKIIQS